jgi:hypothetical protein
MKTFAALLVGCLLWLGAPSDARAQVAYVTYYQPMTVYSPPVVYSAPQTVYYAPAPTVAAVPTVAPVTTVAYAPAPTVSYTPVARVRTRYRPLLGGTVSRVRYGYAPVYYPPAPVVVAY